MPGKCSFCRKRYEPVGEYEAHLRSVHANLYLVLASTILNLLGPEDILNARGTDVSDANKQFEHSNSDYDSDPLGDTPHSERDRPADRHREHPKHKYSRTTHT